MRLPSKAASFWILTIASAASAFLLPARWTTPGRGLFQPLGVLQWPALWLSQRVDQSVQATTRPALSDEQLRTLVDEVETLRRQVFQQRLRLESAEARIRELTGLTGQLPDAHMSIVIAPVVACDADRRGATLLITKGRQPQWLREGQWVVAAAARLPEWDQGATLRDLLDRGWLVGRVVEVRPRLARVQLVSDPRFRCVVRPARVLADGTVQLAPESALLVGRGAGRAAIQQAPRDYYAEGYRLLIVPATRELPVAMTIGRVAGSQPRGDSAQHFDLEVVPWGAAEELTHVYVLATEP